ncbi:chorismate synthase [Capnocytophaga haemolytica]|uniref:Chorismate synthase n=1 Tax=Capnocytophaga haemolytica TaxID=45243 RepID=A0AAX2H1B0_9FLAO|nr:chorismate synthase [Capnocytophaga haemolytica]AMD85689.1 chorismate synthase [Capnocytophaga haemolytica]SFN90752.1 chorismate synthase [Capnocytophaga haemolytica]SNV16395.1 Chorismate synthase [Capnocytophaga haemolytica]
MAGNTFGRLFRLTTFGESHGEAIGGVIDGCPPNVALDFEAIQRELDRRKPGQSAIVTQRKESDRVRFLSGLFEGRTTGTPIGFVIENEAQRSGDYDHIKEVYRPSHADYTYAQKYGIRDYRGGGRSSARETAARVVAGAIGKQLLKGVSITAYTSAVGEIALATPYEQLDLSLVEANPVRCPDVEIAAQMEAYIKEVRKAGDTVGGVVSCVVQGVPIGLGEPVFDKLHAELGRAMLSINAVKGFEYGSGFAGARMRGSAHNDRFNADGTTRTNYSGGVQGGISNGMDIYFNVAFKPVATLMQEQEALSTDGRLVAMQGKGRHDPCVVPRAVPIVEAMTALVLVDFYLRNKAIKI